MKFVFPTHYSAAGTPASPLVPMKSSKTCKATMGFKVNGKLLVRQILQHRDVIELGNHQLCFMSSRIANDVEFERTMLIQTLPQEAELPEGFTTSDSATTIANTSVARSSKTRFAEGRITVLADAITGSRQVGERLRLQQIVTTFGTPGEQLMVLNPAPARNLHHPR